jgi:hypothetical protein
VRGNRLTGVFAVLILLCPLELRTQMPPAPGKLIVSSEPPGAMVTINGNSMSQPTNATFLVSPGNYTVAVSSPDGKLRCPGTIFAVSAGGVVSHTCTAAGWK